MGLYTFFISYQDGTHVYQVNAESPSGALESWISQFDITTLLKTGKAARQELLEAIVDDHPVPVSGIKGTWCWSTLLEDKLLLVHFTETAGAEDESSQ